jgi:hypothetical protein
VALDRPRILSDQKALGDCAQSLCAIALHVFRPADDSLIGGDLQKRIDPPAGIAMQDFDLDDLHRPSPRLPVANYQITADWSDLSKNRLRKNSRI